MLNKNLMVLLGCFMAINRLDIDSKQGIEALRLGFFASCLYCSVAYYWVYSVVEQKQDKTPVEVTPATDDKPAVIVSTYEYDMQRLGDNIKSFMSWIIMIFVLHLQSDAHKPLFLMAMMNPSIATESPLFRIHVLGEDDRMDALERPWGPENLFTNLGLMAKPKKMPRIAGTAQGTVTNRAAPADAPAAASAPSQ